MSLQSEIIAWFKINRRDLPWRGSNPWGVLVSEFMLQQTPVNRVLPIWQKWLERWPTPRDLAAATPAEAITAWERLGYPRRALRLHQSAIVITRDYRGEVPHNQSDLRTLPGVGEYTSAAIAAFAFGQRSLVLDTNIRRLLARLVDGVEFPELTCTRQEKAGREALIPKSQPDIWAAATMELGALVCTSRKPSCEICPVSKRCAWRAAGYPASQRERTASTWHGTDRQCRGVIIQALRENSSLTESALQKLWHDTSQIEKALTTLLSDGLIAKQSQRRYCLPLTPAT